MRVGVGPLTDEERAALQVLLRGATVQAGLVELLADDDVHPEEDDS